MRTSIALLGLIALLAPAVATAQDAPLAGTPPTAPPPAEAAPPPPPMAQPTPVAQTPMVSAAPTTAPSLKGFSLWGIWGWGAVGAGARFMIPLGIAPLLQHTTVRDSFALEFGADFTRWSYGYTTYDYSWSQIVPVVGVMWNIWLNPQFALYPKIEAGYAIGWWTGYDSAVIGPAASHSTVFLNGTGGLLYKLNNGITLRAEAGYAGLKLGAGFLF